MFISTLTISFNFGNKTPRDCLRKMQPFISVALLKYNQHRSSTDITREHWLMTEQMKIYEVVASFLNHALLQAETTQVQPLKRRKKSLCCVHFRLLHQAGKKEELCTNSSARKLRFIAICSLNGEIALLNG